MSSAFKPLPSKRSRVSSRSALPLSQQQRHPPREHHLKALPRSPVRPLSLAGRSRPLPPHAALRPSGSRPPARRLLSPRVLPQWLNSAVQCQKLSMLLTLGLGAAMLSVYSLTFYSQHRWGQEYHKLEELRRNERQMSAYIGMMKNDIASQAERSRGSLVTKSSNTLFFVKPAPPQAFTQPAKPIKPTQPIPPVGY